MIFLLRRAGLAMDRLVIVLGVVMIALTTYVAITSGPPVGDALVQTVAPETVSFLVITTLIGGTVGGYIVYAGAHRLVDNGVRGVENVKEITRSSVIGMALTAIMRVLLFLAVLGAAPVQLLIFAGAFNGLILPVGLGLLLWVAARRLDLLHGYVYPRWLVGIGALAWIVTVYLGYNSLTGLADLS